MNTLTMSYIKSLMDESYNLVWVDYTDNLNERRELIQECLDKKRDMELYDFIDSIFADCRWSAVTEIINNLKDKCMEDGFDEETVNAFFYENDDDIRTVIEEKDASTPVDDIIKNTRDIPIKVEMLSNYDCINSHWWTSQSGYGYRESYFGDMIDTLNLNPAKVKEMLVENGYKVCGRFPNKKSRNGKEQVSYDDFYQEIINSCCPANLLTYIGTISLRDLWDAGFNLTEIVIPKGNKCGIYSSLNGGGSLLEMTLKHDVKLKLDMNDNYGFIITLDSGRPSRDYSIQNVYGVNDSFFGEKIRIITN